MKYDLFEEPRHGNAQHGTRFLDKSSMLTCFGALCPCFHDGERLCVRASTECVDAISEIFFYKVLGEIQGRVRIYWEALPMYMHDIYLGVN